MKTCPQKLKHGNVCGAEIMPHLGKHDDGTPIEEILCKNKECPNYYICACGVRFGAHGRHKPNISKARNVEAEGVSNLEDEDSVEML